MSEDQKSEANIDDALAAMAGGADLDEKKKDGQEQLSQDAIDTILATGGTLPAPAPAPADVPAAAAGAPAFPAAPAAPAIDIGSAKRVSASVRNAREAGHMSRQYKKMMQPLLVIVGAVLIVAGGFGIYFSNEPVPLPTGGWTFGLGSNGLWFGLIALPFGLILLVGSWLIRMDLKRTAKE